MQDRTGYHAYLQGDHWRLFRSKVLQRTPTCSVCGAKADTVHHLTYERIGCELFSDVKALCNSCHDRIHAVHAEQHIPWSEFERAARIVKSKFKLGRKRKPRKTRRGSAPILSSDSQLGPAEKATIRELLGQGYKPGYIAKINGWPSEEVSFLAGRIKREMKS